jgi:NIMA (never in mitosis gene a)-related kinase
MSKLTDFEILEKIGNQQSITQRSRVGEGSYSTVHRVRRRADDLEYAMKQVKIKKLSEKERDAALNEVRLLASLNSPFILSFKQAFIDEDLLW